jgi:hypothetical protein
MTRQRMLGWMAAGVAMLAAAGWLYAQDGGQRPPQGGDGPGGGQGFGRGQQFRPMMMMPAQMVATADYIFIVRGNTLYKYDIKELKLQGKAELEMPAMQRPPQEGAGQQPPPPPQQ